ncbi:MAG: STAS domain-containing protein [Mycobacterium sp.]|nr:STAS domain-containing protein [Mycobacterium sp.]
MVAALNLSTHRAEDGSVELTSIGELDLSTIDRFQTALRDAVAEAGPNPVTLDLSGVEYLDSAAINVLFDYADRISVVRVNPLLVRGLSISGLDQIVEIRSADQD